MNDTSGINTGLGHPPGPPDPVYRPRCIVVTVKVYCEADDSGEMLADRLLCDDVDVLKVLNVANHNWTSGLDSMDLNVEEVSDGG